MNAEVKAIAGVPVRMTELSEEDRRILSYLRESVAAGDRYFRSSQIADAVGLSAKQVGARLAKLRDVEEDIDIDEWGRSRSVTWHVKPAR